MMHHQLQVRGLHITPDSGEKVHLLTVSEATTDSVPCCVMLHGAHETQVATTLCLELQLNNLCESSIRGCPMKHKGIF